MLSYTLKSLPAKRSVGGIGKTVTIALDGTPLTISTGGVARYTLELARAMAEAYPSDRYWLLSDQPFPCPEPAPPNLHCEGGLRAASRRWWSWGLPRRLTQLGVDVFHGTDFSVPYLPLRPSVMTVHDLSPWIGRELGGEPGPVWQPDAKRVRRRTPILLRLGAATMVITPTEAIRRAAIGRFGLRPNRVVAVPLAAPENFRPVEIVLPETPYFLFVGTLEPRKDIAGLLAAWREIRKTHAVDLVLAGRARRDFEVPSREPGLRVLGAVDDGELPALYSGAAACVYPSLYEGFGLPVLEAMQCGALAIASRDPAIQEVTGGADARAAIHVDAADTKALTEALRAAVRDPSKFAETRERALARAREFSWRRTAKRTREVYDEARRVFTS